MDIPDRLKVTDDPGTAKLLLVVDSAGKTIPRVVEYCISEGYIIQINRKPLEEVEKVETPNGVQFKNFWNYDRIEMPFTVKFK